MLDQYYNRHDPAKGFARHLFVAGRGLQSAELNEIQDAAAYRLRGLADALFKDGDIVRDCACSVDADTGATTLASGALYIRGAVRGVVPAQFTVPVDQSVTVGVYLTETVITELEDPTLRDPAVGTRNYQEPGALRMQENIAWGWSGDGQLGEFFPVYTVENGVLLQREAPPQMDGVTTALARYDRDSAGGNYIISGLLANASQNLQTNKLTVTVGEGRARVNGFGVELPTSVRMLYDRDPDTKAITSEPHTFAPGGDGKMRVNVDVAPLVQINSVRITAERTATLTHGAFTGAKDPLPENSVLQIMSVTQGGTTYVAGTDYKLTANEVDWSLTGAEPAPGSTYTVTFRYLTVVEPEAVDMRGFTVGGAVDGTLVTVDYAFAMPRIDVIALDSDGRVVRLLGVSNQRNPAPPAVPDTMLQIATLRHNWETDPVVVRDAVRAVPMQELEAIKQNVASLFDLVAIERLRNDVGISESASKRGVFVDPFNDDDLRDAGVEQTAAIVGGELVLPISASPVSAGAAVVAPVLLPYTLEAAIEQTARTGSMLVNPYSAFDPIPANVELAPAVDRWTVTNTEWASDETRRVTVGSGNASSTSSASSVEILRSESRAAEFLRPIQVQFDVRGFGPGEALAALRFDGIEVAPEAI